MIGCAFLTQGHYVPSSRFRVEQYIPLLRSLNVDSVVLDAKFGAYPPMLKIMRYPWAVAALLDSYARVSRANDFDVVFLQRELISTLYSAERFLRKPYVFDVDDSIFLNARGLGVNKIASSARMIVVGNRNLAEYFSDFGEVVIIPTPVDTEYFSPGQSSHSSVVVLGWTGSSSGLKYLYEIEPALAAIMAKYPEVMLKVVSDLPPNFDLLPNERVCFEQWTKAREVDVLREFSIGLMPLPDSHWERGKCSFKMLTYMSVGKPVVVSPVGMNKELLDMATIGLGASSCEEWIDALSCLIEDNGLCSSFGLAGRRLAVQHFDTRMQARRLAEVLIKSAS